jgi:hypothetical protein
MNETDDFEAIKGDVGSKGEAISRAKVPLESPQKRAARTRAANKAIKAVMSGKSPETVRIQLEETDNMSPTGQFFGLNGVPYNLRPGEPAVVPVGLLNILNDAVMSVPIMNADQSVGGYKDRLRFPYRVL